MDPKEFRASRPLTFVDPDPRRTRQSRPLRILLRGGPLNGDRAVIPETVVAVEPRYGTEEDLLAFTDYIEAERAAGRDVVPESEHYRRTKSKHVDGAVIFLWQEKQ